MTDIEATIPNGSINITEKPNLLSLSLSDLEELVFGG